MNPDFTQEQLKTWLHYNPDTGVFTWLGKVGMVGKGSIAGSLDQDGYTRIKIADKRFYAHRLAWFYMTGEWPNDQIDHIDRKPSNNTWKNLREATHSQNQCNKPMQKNNQVGFKGVTLSPNGKKYQASIRINNQSRYLGRFETPEEAHAAYLGAAKVVFGKFGGA